jgi:hypothetical protein
MSQQKENKLVTHFNINHSEQPYTCLFSQNVPSIYKCTYTTHNAKCPLLL